MKKIVNVGSFGMVAIVSCGLAFGQSPGDIVITEIMQNPLAVSDANGEWFEIYNTTSAAIDINGWTISDNGSDSHTIDNGGTLNVPSDDFLVLCRNGESTTNGGVSCDYEYSGTTLGNSDDEIILTTGGSVEIDRVEYDGGPNFPDPDGSSMYLEDFTLDNNVGSNWTESASQWSGSAGDNGSPGGLGEAAVPIELGSFSATLEYEEVLLTWTTITETENLGFYLYRSLSPELNYTRITDIIRGAGSSVVPHSYSYIDQSVEFGKTYFYKLADVDFNGILEFHGPVSVTVGGQPAEFALAQNYPNPFNPSTTIRFALSAASQVRLVIYNLLGQQVRTLATRSLGTGHHNVLWDGLDDNGESVASGVYLYRLEARNPLASSPNGVGQIFLAQKKLVLAR